MNQYKYVYFLCMALSIHSIYTSDNYTQKYNNSCTAYTDPFGPLKTGYTMGDAIRYAIGDNVSNIYSPGGACALKIDNLSVAKDIKNYGYNTGNLYNAIGYLYAGWLVFNNPLVHNLEGADDSNVKVTYYNAPDWWINNYRNNTQHALHGFDNSKNFCNFTEIPSVYSVILPPQVTSKMTNNSGQPVTFNNPNNLPVSYASVGYNFIKPGDGTQTYGQDSFNNVSAQHSHADWASQSSGWCPNSGSGDWMPLVHDANNTWYLAPNLQFFGGRIAHILGVIVNDVPWSDDIGHTGAKGGTGNPNPKFTSPLISGQNGQGTALPMFAVMQNGPWALASQAFQEMIEPSTAHFGSLEKYINHMSKPSSGWSLAQNYIRKHLLPTVLRLKSVASYGISMNQNSINLIRINDTNITAYDQGVVVAIQNNTGDALEVNQVVSGTLIQIGALQKNVNNFFLNTASLISSSDQSVSTTVVPASTNIISISDSTAQQLLNQPYNQIDVSVYLQVLSGNQLGQLVNAFNGVNVSSTTNNYVYNQTDQNLTEKIIGADSYLVITNFNPAISTANSSFAIAGQTTGAIFFNCRIQAINLTSFENKPYFVTIQINKQKLESGLLPEQEAASSNLSQILPGINNTSFLYPSITSCKICTWESIINQQEAQGDYAKIPLLMMPDSVWNAQIAGLQAYYLIWLMSYAAAITECSYNQSKFGDRLGLYNNVFGLFANASQSANLANVTSGYSSQTSRIIVDSSAHLTSGSVLKLDDTLSIMGCDTWDTGNGFNQDIPILNLSKDTNSNVVANKVGAEFTNLSITFGTSNAVPATVLKTVQQTELIGMVPQGVSKTINVPNYSDASGLTFKKAYGLPYNNIMMFALPTQALQHGVNITMTQPVAGNYQFKVTSTKDFTDQDGNALPAGTVLAMPQIYIDTTLYNVSDAIIDFLHVQVSTSWNSPQAIKVVQVGDTLTVNLKYSLANAKNILTTSYDINTKNAWSVLFASANQYSFDVGKKSLESFNFNTNNFGFSFISNPWNAKKPVSADISSNIANLSYFKFAMMGMDSNNNPIFSYQDIGKLDHFDIYIFDENNKQVGNTVSINLDAVYPILAATAKISKAAVRGDMGSYLVFGGANQSKFTNISYPFVLEFKNILVSKKPLSLVVPKEAKLIVKSKIKEGTVAVPTIQKTVKKSVKTAATNTKNVKTVASSDNNQQLIQENAALQAEVAQLQEELKQKKSN